MSLGYKEVTYASLVRDEIFYLRDGVQQVCACKALSATAQKLDLVLVKDVHSDLIVKGEEPKRELKAGDFFPVSPTDFVSIKAGKRIELFSRPKPRRLLKKWERVPQANVKVVTHV